MKINILKKWMMVLPVIIAIAFNSCKKDDDDSQVILEAFGPSPVLRGNTITFIGMNLDKVTSITIPNNIEVVDITVTSNSEISITVPQEAEEGNIILNYNGGSITTKTLLGFTEPFEISSVAPTDKSIREGEEVVITGDYLYNIVKVGFSGTEAIVDSAAFTSLTRKEIKLKVPKEAISGTIYIEDASGNQLFSEKELSITQPTISNLSPISIKAGENLTITGKDLDLIEKVAFTGSSTIVTNSSFESVNPTTLVLKTPADIHDGKIILTAYSGVQDTSAQSLTTILPTNLSINAVDRYKAGLNVTVSGNDLDLVSSVVFSGSSSTLIPTYDEGTGTTTVIIPSDAVDGVVTLNTLAGKSVATDAITLVKPIVTSFLPSTVTAGDTLEINGTDLDLVSSVTFTTDLVVSVTPESDTKIKVAVPESAINGDIVLTLTNGATVTNTSLTVNPLQNCYIPEMPTDIIEGEYLSVKVNNPGVLTEVKFEGNVLEHAFLNGYLVVSIPFGTGTKELKLVSSNGEATYQIKVTESLSAETIWEGSQAMGNWSGSVQLATSLFSNAAVGKTLILTVTSLSSSATYWQVAIKSLAAGWPDLKIVNLESDATSLEVEITQEILDAMKNYGIVIAGYEYTLTKVQLK